MDIISIYRWVREVFMSHSWLLRKCTCKDFALFPPSLFRDVSRGFYLSRNATLFTFLCLCIIFEDTLWESPRHKDLCSSTDFEALMNETVGCRPLAELYLSISTMPLEVPTVLSLPGFSVITLNLRSMAFSWVTPDCETGAPAQSRCLDTVELVTSKIWNTKLEYGWRYLGIEGFGVLPFH